MSDINIDNTNSRHNPSDDYVNLVKMYEEKWSEMMKEASKEYEKSLMVGIDDMSKTIYELKKKVAKLEGKEDIDIDISYLFKNEQKHI